MSTFAGMPTGWASLQHAVPTARRELVKLEHPYSQLVRQAITEAYTRVIDHARQMLIASAFSPIPKDTGFLRSQTNINISLTPEGAELVLTWPGVPYAEHLLAKAGTVEVRHAKDPMAENPWMEPSLRMVWHLFYSAVLQTLSTLGVEYTTKGGLEALGIAP